MTEVVVVAVTFENMAVLTSEDVQERFWLAGVGLAKVRVHAVTRVPVSMIVPLLSFPLRLFVVPHDERLPFGLPVTTWPVLSIAKRVEVANAAVDEPIANADRLKVDGVSDTERFANGVLVPIPTSNPVAVFVMDSAVVVETVPPQAVSTLSKTKLL